MKLLSPSIIIGTAVNLDVVPTTAAVESSHAIATGAIESKCIKMNIEFASTCNYNHSADVTIHN